ncbi:MARVEL domain-containing protein [Fusarium keratoplasticum]|uniref:MARVEL domain-containing protein n=1 Tax=Fusarium keratoplasticum TaxID=1328300 RepID=A0ACC0QXZ7_9HYPO|nr:MARVEL domain-containing protein [Fusarium keratoplasticum]KAI8669208.1 MARVEL domain-containing protein [Fusarium keratoplasticum]KAI8673814.1 MARVEL domain-containing protein [Fusarium keratoplasticum]
MRYNLVKMILRGFELLITLLLTAVTGNVIASNIDAAGTATAAVNFVMFVAAVCWIVSIIGLGSFFASVLDKPVAQLVLDGSVVLFTFIAAIVLAAKLRVVDCGDINPKALPGDWIAWGSGSDEKRCRELQASTVFMWFLFGSFCGSLFLTVRDVRSTYGSIRGSRPSMSQIGV